MQILTLTKYIKADLIARLSRDELSPDALTLAALSDHYQVSVTPIYHAINELIEEGYLYREKNRRLCVNQEKMSDAQTAAKSPQPAPPEDHFKRITDDLLTMSLNGESVFLREMASAKKYDISRTSLRNIFNRLAGDGMLEHVPRRGWKLRSFNQHDLDAFIEVRVVLELKALDLAKESLDKGVLQKILDGNQVPGTDEEPLQIDNSLHEYLIKQSDNYYIISFFDRHGRYFDLLFLWESNDRDAAIQEIQQHQRILTALINEDWTTAREELELHLRSNHPVLSQLKR
ncbi:GntR family transcriptional regulator [Gimesia chilikensis]|uniref:Colanic acid/biofilm transcriptional regulator n=1 Tax=Gimesia chilikensis TaxID=2605989 RepID=A0A517PP18_9PLAN|nr:GntR family transcriptional regulator [Gimesia chilikensis]QDT21122.1 colanic acid/biofilm transcriptional regulator [Gimesia chilikensis]